MQYHKTSYQQYPYRPYGDYRTNKFKESIIETKYGGEMDFIDPMELQPMSHPRGSMDQQNMIQEDRRFSPMEVQYKTKTICRPIQRELIDRYNIARIKTEQPYQTSLATLPQRLAERRNERSPKTINIGDTRETIEYNIRTLKARSSPKYPEAFEEQVNYYDNRDGNEYRMGVMPEQIHYYEQPIGNYSQASPNVLLDRNDDSRTSPQFIDERGINYSYDRLPGGTVPLNRMISPNKNYDEMDSSPENEYPTNMPHSNQRNSPSDKKSINAKYYQAQTNPNPNYTDLSNSRRVLNVTTIQQQPNNYPSNRNMNVTVPPLDEVQEKYVTRSYDNMTYKDVKRIVRRFTKVYDPSKNNNGLLVEESQITLPGASDEVFNNRFRVLNKMKRLSNILLSKQTKRRSSPERTPEEPNKIDEIRSDSAGEEYLSRSFNRHTLEKHSRSPLKMNLRRSPENKFKYVSLAMISSKGLNTEDRIILRRMRFEKGGVVDLAQEERRKGRFKIRKVRRSPGISQTFARNNPKYREKAAKLIQGWWRQLKDLYTKKIKYIILIQSVYRGRFVRKYMYDLLYLNYLYLSFCKKIEDVLGSKIRPYVFEKLRNYGKKNYDQEYDILRNLVASKKKKWKILNLRHYWNKWKRYFRKKEKISLAIFKLLRIRAEREKTSSKLRDAFRKWVYATKIQSVIEKYEREKETVQKNILITIEKEKIIKEKEIELQREKEKTKEKDRLREREKQKESDQYLDRKKIDEEENLRKLEKMKRDNANKLKGLLKIISGANKLTRKRAMKPTAPKLEKYLLRQYLLNLLKKIVGRKSIYDKISFRKYFYKYLANVIKEARKDQPKIVEKEPKQTTTTTVVTKEVITTETIEEELLRKEKERKRNEDDEKNKKILADMKAKILIKMLETIQNTKNKDNKQKFLNQLYRKYLAICQEDAKDLLRRKTQEQKDKNDREIERITLIEKNTIIKTTEEIEKLKEIDRQKDKDRKKENDERDRREREKDRQRDEERKKEKEERDEMEEYYKDLIRQKDLLLKARPEKPTVIREEKEVIKYIKDNIIDKLKACEILDRYLLKHTYKYPLEAFAEQLSGIENQELLIDILNIKTRIINDILKKYFDIWRKKTFKPVTDTANKLFVKLLSIMIDDILKRKLRDKFTKWRLIAIRDKKPPEPPKKPLILKRTKPQELFIQECRDNTFKKIKKILNLSEFFKKNSVNRFGKNFLDRLRQTKGNDKYVKLIRKIVLRKNADEDNKLRDAFNKWRDYIDNYNNLKNIVSKLIFSIYNKHKNNNNKDLLNKYFNKWKLITEIDKIQSQNTNTIEEINKETRIVIIKSIIRNLNKNLTNRLIKKYFDKWRKLVNTQNENLPKIIYYVFMKNIEKNGPELLDKLNQIATKDRITEILIKLIPKRNKNEKRNLYKYLLRWKNKMYALRASEAHKPYRNQILNLIITKHDKEDLMRVFNKWRLAKIQKIPPMPLALAIRDLKIIFCNRPFKDFFAKMQKTNPKILRPKGKRLIDILTRIDKKNPYERFIKCVQNYTKIKKIKEVQPKIHNKLADYYLRKYFNRWRKKAKDITESKMLIISRWIKRTYDKNIKDRNDRKDELLRRIITNKDKLNHYNKHYPLRYWKKITTILTDKENAQIIQNFCRRIFDKENFKNEKAKDKLNTLIISIYKKNFFDKFKDVDYDGIKNNIRDKKYRLRKIFRVIDNRNRKYLLRKAFEKWRAGNPKFEKKIIRIQTTTRQLFAKNKLNKLRRVRDILYRIYLWHDKSKNDILLYALRRWAGIEREIQCEDNADIIQDFLKKKIKLLLQRKHNATEELVDILKIIFRRRILDKIKENQRKENIKIYLIQIIRNLDDNSKRILLKYYLKKWNDKAKKLTDDLNKKATIIQTIFRGYRVRNDIDNKNRRLDVLRKLITRYDNDYLLRYYLAKWKRNVSKLNCIDNSNIIHDFCRMTLQKLKNAKKRRLKELYKNLAQVIIKIGTNPRKDVLDVLRRNLQKYIIKKLVKDLNDKRLRNLKDSLYTIRDANRLKMLIIILSIPDSLKNRILKKYFDIWKNKALRDKLIREYLLDIVIRRKNIDDLILKSTLAKWLYKAIYIKQKENEKIISDFCAFIRKRITAYNNWRKLYIRLLNKNKINEIGDINDRLRKLIGLKIIKQVLKDHVRRDVFDDLFNRDQKLLFIKKIKIVIERLSINSNTDLLRKYFIRWRDNAKKITKRENLLKQMLTIIESNDIKNRANILNYVFLIKTIFNTLPRIQKLLCLRKIKDYVDQIKNYERLSGDLINTHEQVEPQRIKPLINKLYKIYAYRVLDKMFTRLDKIQRRRIHPVKRTFLDLLRMIVNRKNDFSYHNEIENENKPFIKKIVFQSKHRNKKGTDKNDLRNNYLSLTPSLVNYLDEIFKKRRQNIFDKIKRKYRYEYFCQAFKKYVRDKEKPNFEEFFELLRELVDRLENDGPKKAKLYKIFRKLYIKKTFYKIEEVYRYNKLIYLINLTMFNKEVAKKRWLRQLIRKWRFMNFVKVMAKKKMELMYKNMHSSYLEMMNSMFSNEDEGYSPSIVKEFERFGNGVGMFVNENPYEDNDAGLYKKLKKTYVFEGMEKEKIKTKKITKVEEKEYTKTGYAYGYGEGEGEGEGGSMGAQSGEIKEKYSGSIGKRQGYSYGKGDLKDKDKMKMKGKEGEEYYYEDEKEKGRVYEDDEHKRKYKTDYKKEDEE